MKKFKLSAVLITCTVLFGCASGAKVENMSVKSGELSTKYDRALSDGIKITDVSGGKKTNPAWTSEISSEAFSEALKNSLVAENIYLSDGRYSLTAELLKVKQPALGISMKVTTHIRYILSDTKKNDSVLLDQTLVVPYTATLGDAFVGTKRLRLANEGSAKENIKELLRMLGELNISEVSVSQ